MKMRKAESTHEEEKMQDKIKELLGFLPTPGVLLSLPSHSSLHQVVTAYLLNKQAMYNHPKGGFGPAHREKSRPDTIPSSSASPPMATVPVNRSPST